MTDQRQHKESAQVRRLRRFAYVRHSVLGVLLCGGLMVAFEAGKITELKELKLGNIEPQLRTDSKSPCDQEQSLLCSVRTKAAECDPKKAKCAPPDLSSLPYQPGEHYSYKAYHKTLLSSVFVGRCSLETGELHRVNDRWAIRFRLATDSADWYKWVFVLKDTVEGYFDVGINQTLFVALKKHENTYRQSKVVEFDYSGKRTVERDDTGGKVTYKQFELAQQVVDPYSIIYLIRQRDLDKDKEVTYDLYSNGKVYSYRTEIQGRYKIKVAGKEREAFKASIVTKVEGALEQKGGIFVFFSADKFKIPLMIKADVFVGQFVLELDG